MNINEVQTAIEAAIPTEMVKVESADNIHFYVTVVSSAFDGLMKMKQHKLIMDIFREQIASESIHAMSLKTFTPEKWAQLDNNTAH